MKKSLHMDIKSCIDVLRVERCPSWPKEHDWKSCDG